MIYFNIIFIIFILLLYDIFQYYFYYFYFIIICNISILFLFSNESRIKELEEKINKLNIQLKEEQNKNFDLLKQNKNLQNKINNLQEQINNQNNNLISQNNNEIIKLYKKIEDLNDQLKRYPYILEKDEKLMSVIFTSVGQKTHYSLICKNTHTINNLEPELYKEYPDYCYSEM